MRHNLSLNRRLTIAVFALGLSACGGNSGPTGAAPGVPVSYDPAAPAQPGHHHATSKIQHVVIIVQENRTLNNLLYGFPGAKTQTYGYNTAGKKIALQPVGLETTWDISHSAKEFLTACNGTGSIPGTDCQMNGFNAAAWQCDTPGYPACPNKNPPYSYVPHAETKPYFALGKQYVVADQMYASNFDGSSFVSHQYIIAAQAESSVNYPSSQTWGCSGGSGDQIPILGPDRQFPDGQEQVCFTDDTLGQEADKAGVSWAFYTGAIGAPGGIWNAYQANNYVYYGSDWKNDVITPQTQFFTDVSNGKLRQITWVTPTCANSDHAGCGSKTGPMWVASLVNAIGQSKYWNSTAIFIFWDDYGGWYDPEAPAYVDNDGLGFRLPMIIVSAYAKHGYVSHVHYEHGSILRFVENTFGLPQLSASDSRATPPDDAFDFKKPPRKFKVIPSVFGKDYFMHQPLDLRPVDTE